MLASHMWPISFSLILLKATAFLEDVLTDLGGSLDQCLGDLLGDVDDVRA